jgi:hypothetical protein
MSDSDCEDDGGNRCPYCDSTDDCEHLLLYVDTTFRTAEGGLLMYAFDERWAKIADEGNEDPDFNERAAFRDLLEEVDSLASFSAEQDFEGGPGRSSAYELFYAKTGELAKAALQRFMGSVQVGPHLMFHGDLSDAPGRNESWDEYVEYHGGNQWFLIIQGTDFSGMEPREPVREPMMTDALVDWVVDRDGEDEQDPDSAVGAADDEPGADAPRLGPRAYRLREIAVALGVQRCVSQLDDVLRMLDLDSAQSEIRVLAIKGVTQRGVWIRIYHSVYEVETNKGTAYLYPPDSNREARIVLKTEGSMSTGSSVTVPADLMPKIEALRGELDALKNSR